MRYHERLRGNDLLEFKRKVYLFRINSRMSFAKIGEQFGISRQLAAVYYYDVLRDRNMRAAAKKTWDSFEEGLYTMQHNMKAKGGY